ncbi:MAG: hypothetical protein R2778_16885 [Saprospiraceae bacterium]
MKREETVKSCSFRMLMVHLRKHHERQNTFQMANLFQNTKALLSPLFMLPKAWVAPEPLTLLFLRDDNTHTQGEISRFGCAALQTLRCSALFRYAAFHAASGVFSNT